MTDDTDYTDEDAAYEVAENQIEDVPAFAIREEDPFAEWFMPGYVTEMDYMNAMEADDYRDEVDYEF